MNRKDDFSPNQRLAGALWLAKNTRLRPIDIASLIPGIHEFQAILLKSETCHFDFEEFDPVERGMITKMEIDSIVNRYDLKPVARKIKRYIPKTLREQIPGVITWLKIHYPSLKSRDIAFALGTTPKRIKEVSLREGIDPVHPVASQVLNDSAFHELIALA